MVSIVASVLVYIHDLGEVSYIGHKLTEIWGNYYY